MIARGQNLEFALGYSHPIVVEAPAGIAFAVESPTRFSVQGIDKRQVGEIAANIRKLRKPEPYKGKASATPESRFAARSGRLGRSNGYRDLRAQPSASRPGRRPRPPPPTSSKKITGSAQRPRLVVTRSLRHMVVQVVDDSTGRTLASASSMESDLRGAADDKTAKARSVGEADCRAGQVGRHRDRCLRPGRQQLPRPSGRGGRCPRRRPEF